MTQKRQDRLHIRDLRLRCVVGINPDERLKKQDVVINVTLYADLVQAGKSDRISDTVDYKNVKDRIVDTVETSDSKLIEHLADRIARICLSEAGVEKVRVTVDKPHALRFAQSVAVEIERESEDHE